MCLGSGQELSQAKVLVGCWHNRAHDDELPLTLDNKKQQQQPRAQKGIMTWTILLLLPRHEVDESEDEGEEEGVAERE